MSLLAALGIVLSGYSGQNDIVVGVPVANRPDPALEHLIGFFVNTLPLRVRIDASQRVEELLRDVRRATLEAYQHQDVPYEEIVGMLARPRTSNRSPLFQIMLVLDNAAATAASRDAQLPGLVVEPLPPSELRVRYHIELHATEHDDRTGLYWLYNRDLFDHWRIEQMARHFERVVGALVSDRRLRVGDIALVDDNQRAQVLERWNPPSAEHRHVTLVDLFEAQVARTPDAIAVVCDDSALTYAGLNRQANRLAHLLIQNGVGPGDVIAIGIPRSEAFVLALMGIVKAGAAWLSLDLDYPASRLEYMLNDAAPAYVVCTAAHADQVPSGSLVVLDDAETARALCASNPSNPDDLERRGPLTSEHPTTVIYTSGSTGTPKGCVIPHRSVPGFMQHVSYAPFDSAQVLLQHSSVSWDAMMLELWPALLTGGRTVVSRPGLVDGGTLASLVHRHGITIVWLTSSLFNTILDTQPAAFGSLSHILVGGEALSPAHVRRALASFPRTRLVNGYGPSECTVFACCHPIHGLGREETMVPIGNPIGDRRVYVLDRALNPAPVGAIGDVYIAGPAVALGYLNRPALTAAHFVADPHGPSGSRMYRTGDRAQWHPNQSCCSWAGTIPR